MATAKLKPSESKIKKLIEIAQLAAAGVPLDTEQAAGYLQLAPGTLSVWRSQKKGPKFVLVSTSPRYMKADLDAFIASCQMQRRVSPNVGRPPGSKARRRAVRR